MRIAQVAPLYESVPPRLYGGTERVVAYLTDSLMDAGVDVTLFASGDSQTSARLVAPCPQALRLLGGRDPLAYHVLQLEQLRRRAGEFDLIHLHTDYLAFPLMRQLGIPYLATLHGRLDLPDLVPLYRDFADAPVVSISDAQREPLPWLGWVGTVHHGLPMRQLRFSDAPQGYLAFLGRISPEKRPDRAVAVAKACGLPLKIAAKVDAVDREYFETRIRRLLEDPLVEFVGEIDEVRKSDFLGGARALLFPIDWEEPFGLVLIEALACGTPVIAYRRGSVPEIVEDGVTGFVVDDEEEAAEAVRRLGSLSRVRCREVFERRFSAKVMAVHYVRLYQRLLDRVAEPEKVEAVEEAA